MNAARTFRAWKQQPMLWAGGILAIGLMAIVAAPRGHAPRPLLTKFIAPAVMGVAASHPLPAGSIVGPNDIKSVPIKSRGQFSTLLSREDVLGRVIIRPYATGALISRDDIRDASTLGIAARIMPGQLAYSIRVMEDEIVGGFLQSGNRVDIFATLPSSVFPTRNASEAMDRSRTILLLQDVLVLAVGDNPETHGTIQAEARTVSLSLPPNAVAQLALAQRLGKVSLAIRAPSDQGKNATIITTLENLAPLPSPLSKRGKVKPGIPFYSGANATSLAWSGGRR